MEADKEEIRARSDIVEIIGAVVQLQRRGRNWVGLCPFHQEKTPSFNVDPVTQSFKCFGCGVAGDVFTFVQRHENMSFIEAAEHLARRAGVELARRGGAPRQPGQREALYEVNAAANTYFRRALANTPEARSYLERRGMLPDTIERWQIGFAPNDWEGLATYLKGRKFDAGIAATAGLLHPRTSSGHYDTFRNRIMFPIHDDQQRIVGFGGRTMGDDQPKYLNTGETPIFIKSKLLFGLPHARKSMAEFGYALLMEGYTDVISAHQAGFTAAVATLGTSLTTEHARRLARLAPRVVIAYDGDSPGIKAALRAAVEIEKESVQVRIVTLPAGDDPDSLIRSGRADRLKRAIDHAVTRVQFELDQAQASADQETEEGRQELLRRIAAILATVPTRVERDTYIERVWRLHPLSIHGPALAKEQLHRDAEQLAGRGTVTLAPRQTFRRGESRPFAQRSDTERDRGRFGSQRPMTRTVTDGPVPATSRLQASELLLLRALASPIHRRTALDVISADDLLDETDRRLWRMVQSTSGFAGDEAALMELVRSQHDDTFSQMVAERLQESLAAMANEPITDEALSGAAKAVRERRLTMVEGELRDLLKTRAVLTEEDRDRVKLLKELQVHLRGSP